MSCRLILSLAPTSNAEALHADDCGADLVEYRLEGLREPDLEALFAAGRLPGIATCRPHDFAASEHARAGLLRAALAAGTRYVDVEWEAWAGGFGRFVPPERLILSHHGPHTAPPALADAMRQARPAVVKIVLPAEGPRDVTVCHALTAQLAGQGQAAIVLASGEKGSASRVLTALWGGWATYAAPHRGRETAAGQPTLAELMDLYRIRALGRGSFVAAVAGWPLRHSLSPALHNALYGELGLDGVYVALPGDDAQALVETFREEGLRGLSVTRPLKRSVVEHADRVAASARRAGAANTLIREPDGDVTADNTDAPALRETLEAAIPLAGTRVMVLGAGGTARAAAAALSEARARVTVTARRPAEARELAAALGVGWLEWESLGSEPWDVLVQATPVGQQEDRSPLRPEQLTGRAVLDLVYVPERTLLLRTAADRGLVALSGLEVFVRQAAHQIRLWTGESPEPELLRRLVARLWSHKTATGR